MLVTVAVRLTENDRAADYFPSMDGYRPGAQQTQYVYDVELAERLTFEQIAEAAFTASNAPYRPAGFAGDLQDAMAEDRRTRARSLSVGDTVLVGVPGEGTRVLAVASFGFETI